MNFLNKMSDRWNISLFHYRNHGADFGRVLIGIQVPPQEKEEFTHFWMILVMNLMMRVITLLISFLA